MAANSKANITQTSNSNLFRKELKKVFLNSLNVNTYFIILLTCVVVANGVYDLHIDVNDILIGYTVIVGKNLINHGINSVLNSKNGEMPVKTNQLMSNPTTNNNTVVDKK